jgi:nucleoside-diphosphate-sugar epimerase
MTEGVLQGILCILLCSFVVAKSRGGQERAIIATSSHVAIALRMKILVTGAAGFIGMHVSERLLARGDEVLGLDNLNDCYDPSLKANRLRQAACKNFMPIQDGGAPASHADVSELGVWAGFKPATGIRDGAGRFVDWCRTYYGG